RPAPRRRPWRTDRPQVRRRSSPGGTFASTSSLDDRLGARAGRHHAPEASANGHAVSIFNTREVESARAANSVCSLPRLRGRGGEGVARTNIDACPLPVPPAEVGCFRLRPVNKVAELG